MATHSRMHSISIYSYQSCKQEMQRVRCLVMVVVVEEGTHLTVICRCEATGLVHLGIHSFCLCAEIDRVGDHRSIAPHLFKGPRDDHTLAYSGGASDQHCLVHPQAGLQMRRSLWHGTAGLTPCMQRAVHV